MSTQLKKELAASLRVPRENVLVLDAVDSTNTYCKELALHRAADGTVVMANEQTGGRGRLGRTYQSKGGLGLYLSILWRARVSEASTLALPALGAVAACRAIERVCGEDAEIKWPNDLVCCGKKLGGILCEAVWNGGEAVGIVMGIGINVHHCAEDFDGEVAEIASSLEMMWGKSVARGALAAALIEELDDLRRETLEAPQLWLAEYRRRCMTVGHEVQLIACDRQIRAMALDIDESYGLVVRLTDGTVQTVRSGEVSVRGLYGYAP